jgi:hypothetical protein
VRERKNFFKKKWERESNKGRIKKNGRRRRRGSEKENKKKMEWKRERK